MAIIFTSTAIDLSQLGTDFRRADVEFIGVEHVGASFEGRVFFDNPKANVETETTETNGYVGSFFVFGHGGCFGDIGHCEPRIPRAYDPRPAAPTMPADKNVIATEAIRRAVAKNRSVRITVVPIVRASTSACNLDDVLIFNELRIISYE